MPYLFRCTYCNREVEIDPWSADFERNCDDCGEDMCKSCVNIYDRVPLCDSCLDNRENSEEDE